MTVPVVIVPSPQLIDAMKSPRTSLRLVSVRVASVVVAASAVPSTGEIATSDPVSFGAGLVTSAVLFAVAAAVPGGSSVSVTVTVSVLATL